MKDIYGVDVTEVKTVIMPGKSSRIGRTRNFSKPRRWKKAVVKLKKVKVLIYSLRINNGDNK